MGDVGGLDDIIPVHRVLVTAMIYLTVYFFKI